MRRWRPATRSGRGATPGSSSSVRVAPTLPRWCSSSSSDAARGPALVTKLTLEYDGGAFAGWARQSAQRSVQGELERALQTFLGEPVALAVAGRTDRGVHAWGQVVSYRHEAVDPMRLNAVLPDDVAVLDAVPQVGDFDARHDATSRTYCYRVLVRRTRSAFEHAHTLWWGRALEVDSLHACAALVLGRHDFTAFTPTETEHHRFERTIRSARWHRRGDILEFWVQADSFLRHMNRTLVGTMLEVASGQRDIDAFGRLLEGRPRADAGPTAAPHALHLAAVSYPPR